MYYHCTYLLDSFYNPTYRIKTFLVVQRMQQHFDIANLDIMQDYTVSHNAIRICEILFNSDSVLCKELLRVVGSIH